MCIFICVCVQWKYWKPSSWCDSQCISALASLQLTAAAAPAAQSSVSSWSTWKSAWSCLLPPGQTGLTDSDQKMSDSRSFWEQEDLVYLSQSNQIHAGFDSVSWPYRTASLHCSHSKAKKDCAESTCVSVLPFIFWPDKPRTSCCCFSRHFTSPSEDLCFLVVATVHLHLSSELILLTNLPVWSMAPLKWAVHGRRMLPCSAMTVLHTPTPAVSAWMCPWNEPGINPVGEAISA